MSFEPVLLLDGSLNPRAVFACAMMVDALYHGDRTTAQNYADGSGGRLVNFVSDAGTYPPDTSVIINGTQALVSFGGTTNFGQWCSHISSAYVPAEDEITQTFVVHSFAHGEFLVESDLNRLIVDNGITQLTVTGHSYGAACAHIWATHLLYSRPNVYTIDLLTFGEPMAYSGQVLQYAPRTHNRLWAFASNSGTFFDGADPVPSTPPPSVIYMRTGYVISVVALLTRLRWQHRGQPWKMLPDGLVRFTELEAAGQNVPFIRDIQFVTDIPFAAQHFMDSSYLAKALALLGA